MCSRMCTGGEIHSKRPAALLRMTSARRGKKSGKSSDRGTDTTVNVSFGNYDRVSVPSSHTLAAAARRQAWLDNTRQQKHL